LAFEPRLPLFQNIRAILLAGVQGLIVESPPRAAQ
jgi:hypothetical protein